VTTPSAPTYWSSPDRAFPYAASILCLIAITPIWTSRFLPLLDEPNHLSAIYIWRELSHADSPLHRFYDLRLAPVSYFLHYALSYLFSFVLGVELAHKLVLSLYVLSFPVAGWLWCRATGRTTWLCLTTIPLAYSVTWAHGFHSFHVGLAVCLFGVVAQDALLRAPGWPQVGLAAALALACYFGHPLPLVSLWLCTGLLWLTHRPGLRACGLSALSLVPSALMYGWQARATHVGAEGMRAMLGPHFPLLQLTTLTKRVLDFAEHAVNPVAGETDSRVFEVVLLGCLLLYAVGAAHRDRYRGLLLAAGMLGLYFVLPEHFYPPVYLWLARGRVAALAAFFLLLGPALRDDMRARWLALGVALIGACVPLQTALANWRFGQRMGAFERVVVACPADTQVLTVRIGGEDAITEGFDQPVFRQLPSWVQVVHGGFSPAQFPRPIAFPFAIKQSLPALHWRHHERYPHFLLPEVFGCVLTVNLELPEGGYRLARKEGEFALYVVK